MLTDEELSLVKQVGFESKVAEIFKATTKGTLLPFNPTFTSVDGIAVAVADGKVAEALIQKMQPDMLARGYRAFWTDLREESGLKTGWAVALLRSINHFAILDAAKPWPESHSGPEVIRDKLKSYERMCDLEIVGAAADWVAVAFKSLPSDLCSFAEDIYMFCPDSCDLNSGIGSKRNNSAMEVRAAAQALCPSVSENFRQLHKAKYGTTDFPDSFPDDFYDLLFNDAEWNVRLLARQLKEEMYFFFWWD